MTIAAANGPLRFEQMDVVFCADDVPAATRLDYRKHVIGEVSAPLARQLPAHLDDGSPTDQARLGTAVLDLNTPEGIDRAGCKTLSITIENYRVSGSSTGGTAA